MMSDELDLNDVAIVVNYYSSVFCPPFSVAPLSDKHYGTKVVDACGTEVAKFWSSTTGEPSAREKAAFGPDWTPDAWRDYCSDGHWESETDLEAAEAFARMLTHGRPKRT